MSPRSIFALSVSVAMLALALPAGSAAAADPAAREAAALARSRLSLGVAGGRAFEYFARADRRDWDDYLKSLRPAPVSADRRARALALVRKEDVVEPSPERKAKLEALQPVLAYLERETATEIKLLRLDLAWAGFLEGAAVLISPDALDLLTPAELQAVIAHELAHEYFAPEYEAARRQKDCDTVKEIELRCDAVAMVTMGRLGLDRGALLSGVAKLTAFNERRGSPNSRDLSPSWDERRKLRQGHGRSDSIAHERSWDRLAKYSLRIAPYSGRSSQDQRSGEVLERLVRRMERHLRRNGLLRAFEDGAEADRGDDPEGNLAASAVFGQAPPAGPSG